MRLENETALDAALLRSELPSGRMMAALVLRAAYRVDDEGRLWPLPAASAPAWGGIRRDRVATEWGELDPDPTLPRCGSDLLIFGDAIAGGARSTRVEFEVGPYRRALSIHGERVWERSLAGGLRPSEALPFERIPLTSALAFGGVARGPGGQPAPYASNPRGRGYFLDAGAALGGSLANVEWAGEEVRAWDERPDPAIVGPYPSAWWLRLSRVWVHDPGSFTARLAPEGGLFDIAHPRLSGREIRAGEALVIDGMGPRLAARVPAAPAEVEWVLGEHRLTRGLTIDEVIVDMTTRTVALCWRKVVQYEYVRHQERRALVREARR